MNEHTSPGGRLAAAVDILGTPVARLSRDEAIDLLAGFVSEKRFTPIGFLNAHNANVAAANLDFAHVIEGFLVLPDGIGVDIASKALYGAPFPANLNGTDFVPAFFKALDMPITVGLVGAAKENAEAAAEALRRIAPQHRYIVVSDGYFSPEREPIILEELKRIRPDVLLVAMGVPRQEFWIAQHLTGEHCTLPIGVGALLDFLSGSIPRAPLWVRRWRLEWLFRLVQEPQRLWQRYIFGNPVFLYRVAKQKLSRLISGS